MVVTKLDKSHKILVNSHTPVSEVIERILTTPPGGWNEGFHTWPNFHAAYREIAKSKAEEILKLKYQDGDGSGRGIIISGGGPKYFPSVYVNLRILRLLGCTLPVELWSIGSGELDFHMRDLIMSLGNIECRDVEYCPTEYPARIMSGWNSKVFAIINSKFEECLFLDADNTCLTDPTFLFDEKEYRELGMILWPDAACWQTHDQALCDILGIKYRNQPQVESGQILVNKRKCWHQVHMCKYFCDYSDYYYKHGYGDKTSWEWGSRFLNKEYASPTYPEWVHDHIFGQRALDGSIIFSHRCQAKFALDKSHFIAHGWVFEQETLDLLDELRSKWDGSIWCQGADMELAKKFAGRYLYRRAGIGSRDLEIGIDGVITEGADSMEKHVKYFSEDGEITCVLHGESGPTAVLRYHDGRMVGRWCGFEKSIMSLEPYLV